MKRSRLAKPDTITAAWIAGERPPESAYDPENRELLIALVWFEEHPPKAWQGLTHPYQREWFDVLAESRVAA